MNGYLIIPHKFNKYLESKNFKIVNYEIVNYLDIKDYTTFKPKTKIELQKAINLWCFKC